MQRRPGGFTMVEMLVVVLAIALLVGVVIPALSYRREGGCGRSPCGNNLGNIIKCCHLYSDAVPNLGCFPLFSEQHNLGGQLALSKLYDAYIKDHRVFSCPQSPSTTSVLTRYVAPDETTLTSGYASYGYDPGHAPTHSTAGVVSDRGTLNQTNHRNSMNHGKNGPGENVAIAAGSTEWWDDADHRLTKDGNDNPISDDMFANDIALPGFPEELETNIIP
jgi:prepilin-type N-terminal cleavage/methylation domain-containing protein